MASRVLFNPTIASIARRGVRFASVQVAPGQNAFVAERAAIHEHARASSTTWRRISWFALIVVIPAASANAYNLAQKHFAHMHEHPRHWVQYEYINMRTKPYPWGENTIFWNPAVNGKPAEHEEH
ncbi:cytochrome c oxidase, subunit VIa [Endogone sp. FLAS-F59071]|nr:cytochrome c oxidase, subunit VIa [Endogone sp. FLAS-F59071]|eukprot:RUS21319.1 cytochrome c oxidase, subunit VIa [Endogone sp. FLAS-F59071]